MADADEEIIERPVPVDEKNVQHARIRIRRRSDLRLDKYLRDRFPRMSRTLIARLIKQGKITVNSKPTKPSYEPDSGDVIDLLIPAPEPMDIVGQPIPIDVIYEDRFMLAINKHTGIICHPSKPSQTGTLANALVHYAETLSHGDDPFRPGIVHRLDKNTTGVMLIAKTDEAHWRLGLQFERRTLHKTYMGVLEGEPDLDGDVIDMPLANHPMVKDRQVVPGRKHRPEFFKEAVTRYEVVERFRGFALVHMFPKTGRTHQLRVHMSHIGHPMVGDTMYGGHLLSESDLAGQGSEEPLFVFQALHAFRIEFDHPITEKRTIIEAPPPPEINRLLDLLRKHRARLCGNPPSCP